MSSSVIGKKSAESYTTHVDGRSVKCESLFDVLCLKVAEAIATTGSFGPAANPSPEQLIAVARKYGFDAIADEIEKLR
ncbi:hypothetical protein [Lacipirellula sp.]|uniref:hypothetical protein n=1 Tax=Lacipirellula sp. TaxID=2691419 RepID=UPI003D13D85B